MKKWVQFGTSDGLVSLVNPLELRVTSAAVVEDILNMDTLQEKNLTFFHIVGLN